MGESLEWVETSKEGRIYTFTINRRGANAYMAERTPYAVAIVELKEGVRLMANIINSRLEDVAIGKAVRLVFEEVSEEVTLPQFQLIGAEKP